MAQDLNLYHIPNTSDDNSSAIQDIVDTIGSVKSTSTSSGTGTTPSTGITEQQVRDIVNQHLSTGVTEDRVRALIDSTSRFKTGTNILMDGYLKSQNFYTGVSGWQIDAEGNVEFGSGYFRGDITGASGTFSGTLTATAGVIGGFTISASSLSTGAFDTLNTMYFGTSGLSLSNVFKVTAAGALTALSGFIGGFTLGATEMYGGIIKTAATVGAGNNGVIMDSAGLRGYDSVLGKVFDIHTDGSAPEFAFGNISNSIFEINTNAILRTSSTVGDGSASSAGILINNTGLYACEASQTLANANVKILIDGSATIKMNVKGGQTDYATGTGYFLGLSGGDYKFSIGNPAGNYMTWDGTYLKLKGSFNVGDNGLINNSVYTVANLPVQPTVVGFNPASAYE